MIVVDFAISQQKQGYYVNLYNFLGFPITKTKNSESIFAPNFYELFAVATFGKVDFFE